MLGFGPAPEVGGAKDYLVNAGKQPVTALAGLPIRHRGALGMIRGGQVDVAIMGGLRWTRPPTWPTGRCPASAAGSAARWTWRAARGG